MQLTDIAFLWHKVGGSNIHFEISDEDSASDPRYYGWLAANGAWIIMEWNVAAGTYRYKAGNGLYTANWTARAGLTYVYYNQITIGEGDWNG